MKAMLLKNLLLAVSICVVATPLAAKDKLPETTKDGLKLQHGTELAVVYLKPGETLAAYDKVSILDAYVAFKKNWKRDYNDTTIGLAGRVTDKDVETIKKRLAGEFRDVFSRELEKGGFEVVESSGEGVLTLRPAIINLVVTAPDVNIAERGHSVVRDSGQMTLYLELYDSLTSDKLAEVIDTQIVGEHTIGHRGDKVANMSEFGKTLSNWAEILVKRLNEAKKASSG